MKFVDELLGFMEPDKTASTGGVIVHITRVNANPRNFMDMVIPRVHCDAEKKDRESVAHVHSCA